MRLSPFFVDAVRIHGPSGRGWRPGSSASSTIIYKKSFQREVDRCTSRVVRGASSAEALAERRIASCSKRDAASMPRSILANVRPASCWPPELLPLPEFRARTLQRRAMSTAASDRRTPCRTIGTPVELLTRRARAVQRQAVTRSAECRRACRPVRVTCGDPCSRCSSRGCG